LEQCNVRAALVIESWKDWTRRVGLSFHWDACGIEGMVGEKIVNFNFGRAWWGCRLQIPSVGAVMPWMLGLDRRA